MFFSSQQLDKQMDTTARWNVEGETVTLVGPASLDSPRCSVHATSLVLESC